MFCYYSVNEETLSSYMVLHAIRSKFTFFFETEGLKSSKFCVTFFYRLSDVDLKKTIIYVLTLLAKGDQTKYLKLF
jgi:hypothetical protein